MKYRIACPICGWMLIQASPQSDIDADCPKCKSRLWIMVEERGIRIFKHDTKKKEEGA